MNKTAFFGEEVDIMNRIFMQLHVVTFSCELIPGPAHFLCLKNEFRENELF